MVWYGMVWYGMVWYGMVWYGMVLYGMVRYGMYYLIHEKECFIIFKTRGAAERFRYDKTRLFECIKGIQIRRIVMRNIPTLYKEY